MKILFGMPSKDSWGGPNSSEPPFVKAIARAGIETCETDYVYGDKKESAGVLQRIKRVFVTAIRIAKVSRKQRPDLIHLNTAFDKRTILRDSFTLLFLKLFGSDSKVFLKFHGSEAQEFLGAGLFWRFLIGVIKRFSDSYGVHTRDEISNFNALGFDSSDLYLVKNVIPQAEKLSNQNPRDMNAPFNLLFVARFDSKKCPLETIEAISLLKAEGLDVRLSCVGNGSEFASAERRVSELDLEHVVELPGYVAESEVDRYFAKSDLLIFPTRYGEGFPNVFFKAVCLGLPIVSTRFRYAAEHFEDEQHCVFCEDTPESIAVGVKKLIEDADLARRISANNLEMKNLLTGDAVAEEFVTIYDARLRK